MIYFVDLSHLSSAILLMQERQQQRVSGAGESTQQANIPPPRQPPNMTESEIKSCCIRKKGAKQTVFASKKKG